MESSAESYLILGSGAIETEMATLLTRIGCKVTLAFDHARILPQEDRDTSQRVGNLMHVEGVQIIPRCKVLSLTGTMKKCTCELYDREKRVIEVDRVLVGKRRPNTTHMGFERIGIRLNDDGSIWIDERLQTNVNNIYAVGDVTGGRMFSHAASAMGIVAAENALGKDVLFKAERVPRGIWTSPEVGAVGLSEEEAEAQGYDIEVGDFPYAINGLAMAHDQRKGAVKIVSDAKYGSILGVHVVGARATEIIGEAVLAMELEATVNEFARSLRVHPTFSESMVEAARDAADWRF
jgi:dihydrolipoamide dehydrogenase